MPEYKIKLPSPEEISRKKLDALRHPKLLALRGQQIGPAFSLPDPDRVLGMRGIKSKKTKNAKWMEYRIKRSKRNKIAHQSRVRNGH